MPLFPNTYIIHSERFTAVNQETMDVSDYMLSVY
jgi:hypothetical protein